LGREVPLAGVLFAVGALLLAAAVPLTLYFGKSMLERAASDAGYGWLVPVFILSSALTAGAVLRVTGRVFLGWGPREGPDPSQSRAAQERVDETRDSRDHTPAVMLAVPAVLLLAAGGAGLVPGLIPAVEHAAVRFTDHGAYQAWVIGGGRVHWPAAASSHVEGIDVAFAAISVAGALGLAALGLFGRPLWEGLPTGLRQPAGARCGPCGICTRVRSATTSRGGPRERRCWEGSVCWHCAERARWTF